MHLTSMSLHDLVSHLFVALNNIPSSRHTAVSFSVHSLRNILAVSKSRPLWTKMRKHSQAGFCVDTSFQLIWLRKNGIVSSRDHSIVYLCTKLSAFVEEWPYHFATTPATALCPCKPLLFFHIDLALLAALWFHFIGAVNVPSLSDGCHRMIVLMYFKCLPFTYVTSLMRFLFRFFVCLFPFTQVAYFRLI